MANELAELEDYLHREIPLTRQMGVRAGKRGNDLCLEAPVSKNSNHLGTAFGGSINAVATLAAYASLWLRRPRERQTHVVVGQSRIEFHRPIYHVIRAVCQASSAIDGRKRRQRLQVKVYDGDNERVAASFEGEFVLCEIREP